VAPQAHFDDAEAPGPGLASWARTIRDHFQSGLRIKIVSIRFVLIGTICVAAFTLSPLFGEASAEAGGPWAGLHRPLHLPSLAQTHRCPRTRSVRSVPGIAAALGRGPAYPTIGSRTGVAYIGPHSDTAHIGDWYFRKTIWTVDAKYQGPLLLRGRRIDRAGPLRFQAYGPPSLARSHAELRWPARWPTENRTASGWRQLPGATVLRGPGCYAFQADGLTFTTVIVFQAILPARSR
jgi:hypothetical protein